MSKEYLTPKELALRWDISTQTLSNWRNRGKGPKFIKIETSIRYNIKDIEKYEAPDSEN